jgi:hypothetical protein
MYSEIVSTDTKRINIAENPEKRVLNRFDKLNRIEVIASPVNKKHTEVITCIEIHSGDTLFRKVISASHPARLRKLIMKIRAKNIRIITPFSRWGFLGSEGESDILVIILIIISYACKLTYIFPNN